MRGILADLKFALRTLRRSPLFTSIAVLSLALGIGANTAIFSLMDQLLLRLLPVKDPESLVMIYQRGPNMGGNDGERANSYPIYQDFQRRAEAFSEVFCQRTAEVSITLDGQTEMIVADMVSGNFFTALGVKPAIGRLFNSREDDQVYKGHPVVTLSHDYWITRFAGDKDVIGRKVLINNHPMTIVGVSAPGFSGVDPAHSPKIRVPMLMKPIMTPAGDAFNFRRLQWVRVFARLKPGYTRESAQASTQVLFTQIRQYESSLPEARNWTAAQRERFLKGIVVVEKAATGYSQLRNNFSAALTVLMCMVGLVLLIACANVANLLIARAMARQKEIAVRLSVGASRRQLVRQLLVESFVLAGAGGALGILFAVWLTKGLLSLLPTGNSVLMLNANPHGRILLFNIGLSLLTGVIFGLAPAFRSTRIDVWSSLKDAVGSVAGAGGGAVRVRKVLVTAQVALSFLLLFGAGLFVQSLQNLKETRTGFQDIGHLLSFQLNPSLNGYALQRAKHFYQRMLENLRALPGVQSAGYSRAPVLAGGAWGDGMLVEGHVSKEGENTHAMINFVSPGYFRTMGVPLLEGRDFDHRDGMDTKPVCIVNRTFAEHYFPGRSAIGRHVGTTILRAGKIDMEIVGVAENALYNGPREGSRRQVFFAEPQERYLTRETFYVRTNLDTRQMFGAIQNTVKNLDPSIAAYEMRTLDSQLDQTLLTERLIAMLSAGFGGLATVLAAVGLYGVMAFVVTRRTKEIGVRMALGARRRSVVWMVLKEVLLLLGIGLALGVPTAIALGRLVSAQLYGVKANDPWVAATVVLLLTAIGAFAGLVPARRASRIDPLLALRYE